MKRVMVVVAAMALSACSSMKTSSDYDPAANFSDIKTYAWVEQKNQDTSYHLDGLMDQRVRAAVESQLSLKGVTQSDPQTADILVNYLTKVDKKINVDTFNTNFGYHPYYGSPWGMSGSMHTQTTVREYEVGTLILDMIDRETGKLIWRGSVADTIREKNTPEERVEVVNKAVAEMMLNYPPKPESK
ncbi:DUF4136 domain-containing protein [uncultured Shewanella sp.]|uniref:DUF4136 domain-containing protein n=1 Tax=Shewanella atlantica TaxID=271099 RepID=UPI002613228D|nr:DUF4136 domain-containing protein [uncultured Shewanella sp.]